jgi:hypothetical protein
MTSEPNWKYDTAVSVYTEQNRYAVLHFSKDFYAAVIIFLSSGTEIVFFNILFQVYII